MDYFVLPYTAVYLARATMERWGLTDTPRGTSEKYGADIRTPPSFEANLEAIAATAERRGDPLVLCTFAYCLPAGYTDEAFQAGKLDYTPPGCPASTWGEPQNIARTIDLHNEATRRVAGRHGLQLIDQRANMPDGGRYYHDCCHLTEEGSARWVENVMNGLDLSKVGRGDR